MKRKMRSVFAALLVMAFGMMANAQTALAAQNPVAEVPVVITLSGTEPETPEKFTVELRAENGENPMPEGSDNGVYTLELVGADAQKFPAISYPKVGVYRYTISQKAGENGDCTYDKAVYSLTVYVTNAENGGLESTTILYKDSENDKLDQAAFHNVYATVSDPGEGGGDDEEAEPEITNIPVPEAKAEDRTEIVTDPAQITAGTSNGGQTGDNAAPALWGALVAAAACAIVMIGMKRKKNENAEE